MLATLLLSASLAADPTGIRLPELAVPTPMPQPAAAVSRLAIDQFYIIDSDVPLLVIASPEGVVSVTEDAGPLKLKGKFADGKGGIETRTYQGKFIFSVEALTTGKVELIVIKQGVGETKSSIHSRRTLEVTGARPPPIDDDIKPTPKPEPQPYTGKFSMVVIEETTDAANNRGQFFADKELQDYLAAKLVGKARIADKDVVDATGQPPKDLVPYLTRAKGKTLPQVYLVAPDGTVLMEGDLPKTPGELLATLKKVGG